jgi:hypothetical protein
MWHPGSFLIYFTFLKLLLTHVCFEPSRIVCCTINPISTKQRTLPRHSSTGALTRHVCIANTSFNIMKYQNLMVAGEAGGCRGVTITRTLSAPSNT